MEARYRVEAARIAYAWYERHRRGLGDQFLGRFEESVALILEMPEAFPTVHGDLRRALLRRFPYSVYYRPLDTEHLEIVGCLHTRQDPGRWRRRGDA